MKKLAFLIIGLIVTGLILIFMAQNKDNNDYLIENQSRYTYDETVAQLEAIVAETEGWKILHTYDLQKSMETNGYKVLPVKVFSLCNPAHSSKILFSNQERVVSSLMPCRVAVYVRQDGYTYISRMNSAAMAANMGGLVNEVMQDAFTEMEAILDGLIQK
jgi:uncharacterized protein (DUF302 family)